MSFKSAIIPSLILFTLFLSACPAVQGTGDEGTAESSINPKISLPACLPAHSRDRILQLEFRGIPGSLPHRVAYAVHLESGPNTADFDGFPFTSSLVYGAWIYALATGDYQVSVSDVVEYGLLPFDVLADYGIELDSTISGVTSERKLTTVDLEGYGSDDWLLRMKNNLLSVLYAEYYFPPSRTHRPVEEMIPPSDLPLNVLFWTNPKTGQFAHTGMRAGDIHECTLSVFRDVRCELDENDPRFSWTAYALIPRECNASSRENGAAVDSE